MFYLKKLIYVNTLEFRLRMFRSQGCPKVQLNMTSTYHHKNVLSAYLRHTSMYYVNTVNKTYLV